MRCFHPENPKTAVSLRRAGKGATPSNQKWWLHAAPEPPYAMAVRHLRGSVVQLLLRQAGVVTSAALPRELLQSLAPAKMATAVLAAPEAKKAKTEYKHTREVMVERNSTRRAAAPPDPAAALCILAAHCARALSSHRAFCLLRDTQQQQAFIDCYNQLRDELVNDELLAGQPQAAEEGLKEVRRWGVRAEQGGALRPPKKIQVTRRPLPPPLRAADARLQRPGRQAQPRHGRLRRARRHQGRRRETRGRSGGGTAARAHLLPAHSLIPFPPRTTNKQTKPKRT